MDKYTKEMIDIITHTVKQLNREKKINKLLNKKSNNSNIIIDSYNGKIL
jgi:hypothetical protein